MGDSHVGLQARLMSQALRKIAGALSNTNTTMIFINQLREKIGVMFGSPETTTGGKALKFYASVRLDIRRIEALKDGTDVVGNRTRVKVVKNKMAPPFKQAEFDIIYGQGISREGSLIDVGVEQGIVRKSGAWYTYDGEQLGQGKENVRDVPAGEPGRRRRDREADQGEARRRRPHRPRRAGARAGRLLIVSAPQAAGASRDGSGRERQDEAIEDLRARIGVIGAVGSVGSTDRRRVPPPDDGAGDEPGDPVAVAKSICLRLLTGSTRTRADLERALRRRGIADDVAGAVLDRLTEVGLIDDAAYAEAFVASRHRDRGLGRSALRAELRRKGVDPSDRRGRRGRHRRRGGAASRRGTRGQATRLGDVRRARDGQTSVARIPGPPRLSAGAGHRRGGRGVAWVRPHRRSGARAPRKWTTSRQAHGPAGPGTCPTPTSAGPAFTGAAEPAGAGGGGLA